MTWRIFGTARLPLVGYIGVENETTVAFYNILGLAERRERLAGGFQVLDISLTPRRRRKEERG